VGIALVTHSAGNLVSALDVALAHKIDSAAALAGGGSAA
jgi:pterin-4a-carbinolamine dehydratase